MARERVHIDVDELVRRYVAGESEKALAEAFGVGRTAVRLRLQKAGVERRNRSAAMSTRMSRTDPDERARLAAAAHEARRGQKESPELKLKRAAAREGKIDGNVSPAEILLLEDLRGRDLDVIPQKAVGPYNIDVATGTVAVEILGGTWHRAKRHGERLRYILDAGWDVIYIWVDGIKFPLGPGAGDYVVSHLQFRERAPSEPRCYRVIRGTGEFLTGGSADGDDIPDVIPRNGRPETPPAEVPYGFCHCGCGQRTIVSPKNAKAKGWVKGVPRRYITGHNGTGPRNAG